MFLIPTLSQAVTRFPQGECRLQGLLVKEPEKSDWYFVVNHTTQSETRFRLKEAPRDQKVLSEGQFVEATLEIAKDTVDLYGEASLQKVEKFLPPTEEAKNYVQSREVHRACAFDRIPAGERK